MRLAAIAPAFTLALLAGVPGAQSEESPSPQLDFTPPLSGLAFLDDGRLALVDGQGLAILEPASGKRTELARGLRGAPAAAAAAPRVAALDGTGDVLVFPTAGGEPVRVPLAAAREGRRSPLSLALSPDGERLAALDGQDLLVFDVEQGKPMAGPWPPSTPVAGLRLAWTGEHLQFFDPDALGGLPGPEGGSFHWTAERRGELEFSLDCEVQVGAQLAAPARALALAPSGERAALALTGAAGGLQLVAASSAEVLAEVPGDGLGESLTFVGEEHVVSLDALQVTEGSEVRLRLRSLPRLEVVAEVQVENPGEGMALCGAATAELFILTVPSVRVDVYQLEGLELLKSHPIIQPLDPEGRAYVHDTASLSPDGSTMALTGSDHSVYFSAALEGYFPTTSVRLPRDAGRAFAVRLDPNLSVATVTCKGLQPADAAREWSYFFEEQIWRVGAVVTSAPDLEAVSLDEARRATCRVQWNGTLERRGKNPWQRAFEGRLAGSAVAPDGRLAIALAGSGRVLLLDGLTGQE